MTTRSGFARFVMRTASSWMRIGVTRPTCKSVRCATRIGSIAPSMRQVPRSGAFGFFRSDAHPRATRRALPASRGDAARARLHDSISCYEFRPWTTSFFDVARRYTSVSARMYARGKLGSDPICDQLVALGREKNFGDVVDVGCGRGQMAVTLLEAKIATRVVGVTGTNRSSRPRATHARDCPRRSKNSTCARSRRPHATRSLFQSTCSTISRTETTNRRAQKSMRCILQGNASWCASSIPIAGGAARRRARRKPSRRSSVTTSESACACADCVVHVASRARGFFGARSAELGNTRVFERRDHRDSLEKFARSAPRRCSRLFHARRVTSKFRATSRPGPRCRRAR